MEQSPGTNPGGQGVATVDIWMFRTEPSLQSADVIGFSVEATDGSIGKVDEATVDAGRSYLIVDTGPWIFGKTVMLPAGVVDCSKDEIKSAPEYEADSKSDPGYRERLGGYYGGAAR